MVELEIGLVGLGIAIIGSGIAIAGSGIGQGISASAAVGATAEKPETFGKNMVFAVLPETQAIYGLLIAILMMVGMGVI